MQFYTAFDKEKSHVYVGRVSSPPAHQVCHPSTTAPPKPNEQREMGKTGAKWGDEAIEIKHARVVSAPYRRDWQERTNRKENLFG